MTREQDRGCGKPGFYRSRNGLLLGVCRGLADHFALSVFGLRCLVLILMVFTGVWPVVLTYFVAAILMKPEPVLTFRSDQEAEFYNSYAENRSMATRRLKRLFNDLQRRIQRMEHIVTSRGYDWERRLRNS